MDWYRRFRKQQKEPDTMADTDQPTEPNPNGDEASEPLPVATMTITLFDNGKVTVQGPTKDAATMYGLLELARETYLKHRLESMQPKGPAIVVPRPGFRMPKFGHH